ncbi:MAG: M15 family metallopeptidase [Pseudomonadota bacterium]
MTLTSLEEILTGKTEAHTVVLKSSVRIHKDAQKPLLEMAREAQKEGFEIEVCSGFRSFDRQIEIWNRKAGADPQLTPSEKIASILRWSALPGTSRHHWGTDLDIIDARALKPEMKVQLVPEEFESGGPFCKLHDWLDTHMESFGFYRPYQTDRGGVSPERWHLSYFPLAEKYLSCLSEDLVRKVLSQSSLLLKEDVLSILSEVFTKYVKNVDLRVSRSSNITPA